MSDLRAPTLQHLVRNWRNDPIRIKNLLVRLAKQSPPFSYSPLYDFTRDLLRFGLSFDEVSRGIREKEKRPSVRDNFLEILPLIDAGFSTIHPDYVVDVAPQYYSIGRNIMVPFQPPLLYAADGKQVLPWFVFWRSNPLSDDQLALFATMVKELMLGSPDLENAELQIFDISVPPGASGRVLRITPEKELPFLSVKRRNEMLDKYAIAHEIAQAELANQSANNKRFGSEERDSNQYELFGELPSSDTR